MEFTVLVIGVVIGWWVKWSYDQNKKDKEGK